MNSEIYASILAATGAFILLVGVIFFIILRMHKQRLQQELKERVLEVNHQLELRKVESDISESVMQYISYELHDNVQHTLTHLRLQLEVFMNQNPRSRQHVTSMENTLDESTEQLRNLCRRLNPDFITENSFTSSVQLEVVKLRKLNKFGVHWSHNEQAPEINKEKLLVAFRIFQEIINNILKHANAKNIYITLNGGVEWVLLVKDDGIGFDYDRVAQAGKLNGLRNMQKRAKEAGLSCELESSPGQGCFYSISDLNHSVAYKIQTRDYD